MYGGTGNLINVTIADNVFAEEVQGGGIYFDHNHLSSFYNEPVIINSIIYDNYPFNFDENFQDMGYGNDETYSFPFVSHSDIQGGLLEHWEDLGWNINLNPMFVDSENGDFMLQEGSPCIDSGTADIDLDGNQDITDFSGDAPDMGAFEFSVESMLGDLNQDGTLDILDIVAMVNMIFDPLEYNSLADMNGDGFINIVDIVLLVNIILYV